MCAPLPTASRRGSGPAETLRVKAIYDREAEHYDRIARLAERLLFGDGRAWAASHASGKVLEIAVGTGRNISFYPLDVRLMGIDVSPAMLAGARRRAVAERRHVTLVAGDAQTLPFRSGRFDTLLGTLALCTIPDERAALSEAWRVLRAGGRLVLLEHVRSPNFLVRFVQRRLDRAATRYAGDHLLRDPMDHLASAGFSVDLIERSRWGVVERVLAHKNAAFSG
jgi:ubiquinone/menaquinone biosynthesis C-methylase UbiE